MTPQEKDIQKKRAKFQGKIFDCEQKICYFHSHTKKKSVSGMRGAPGYFWGSVGHFCMNFWLNRPDPVCGRDFELSWLSTQISLS